MYFGKDCYYFLGQWHAGRWINNNEDQSPEINFCNHSKNENEHEGNCCECLCPLSYKDSDFSDLKNSDNLNKTAIQMINIPTAKEARKSVNSGSYRRQD